MNSPAKFKYAFNLGRVFTLSLAELFSVFENMGLDFRLVDLYREIFIIETEQPLNVQKLQARLGGTIKIMQVLDSLGRKKTTGPSLAFKDYFDKAILEERFLATTKGKIQIGISLYPLAAQVPLYGEAKRLGLAIKQILTVAGYSCRVVLPQKMAVALPSVVVSNERLLEKGAEIDFLVGFERIYLAKTLSVQDFEAYGRRDYQRPVKNVRIGMLPPKVAQIMINLAQLPENMLGDPDRAILDPFAGSGTILQEAMIQNFNTVGSDISESQVLDCEKNLNWVKNRFKLPPSRFEIFQSDVSDIAEKAPKRIYEAVVTEGTLGPGYDRPPNSEQIKKNFSELENIYVAAFKSFKKVLAAGKRVVIALPCYRRADGYAHFPIIDGIKNIGYDVIDPVPEILFEKFDFLRVTDRKSIIYDRKDQYVSREILIFRLK